MKMKDFFFAVVEAEKVQQEKQNLHKKNCGEESNKIKMENVSIDWPSFYEKIFFYISESVRATRKRSGSKKKQRGRVVAKKSPWILIFV
jgi:hypothetical protein